MAEQGITAQEAIKVIDDPVEAVRKLPDVYIGALGNPGFLNMYREIVQNSLDEIIKGHTLDRTINISFDARNYTCIVEDNGQGIDLNMLDKVFSVLHSSSNYDKVEGSGMYSSGKNGMGATITNFLSAFFVAESYRMDGTAGKVEFKEGRLVSNGVEKIKCPKNKHGLKVSFCPSKMMGVIDVALEEVEHLTWLLCNLCLVGTKITFNAITIDGKPYKTVIENKFGMQAILDQSGLEHKVIQPIYFEEDTGTMKVQVLFSYDSSMDGTEIISTANMCPTSSGTHVDGFLDAIVKYFRDYMNKIYLANNKKLQVAAPDIKMGLRAVVSVFHLYPMFTGQAKEIFSEKSIKKFVYDTTLKALNNWASTNPGDLQKVSKYFKDVCEIRSKMDDTRVKMSETYNASAITDLPAKYKRPNSKKPFEVWIVEGDSCASALENNRDKSCQGVFPIRGKMLNAFTTPTKKYFDNEEVAGLFHIFGYKGYAKKFDPAQFKPEKVVIATDADADGAHIQCLVFGLFLKYLPWVITEGKLYVANPPLYGAKIGKQMKFFATNKDYIEYVQNIFCKEHTIANSNGVKYSKTDIVNLLYRNNYYTDDLDKVSRTYAIDPYFLEFLLYNRNLDFKKFKSKVEKAYKFVTVSVENGVIMIRGLVGSKYHTVFFDDRLLNDCKDALSYIDKSDQFYKLDDKMITLYGLMNTFNSFSPPVTRYKGLGEMKPQLLGESTVLPGIGRTLKQFTIDDTMAELKYMTKLQDDKMVFLKDVGNIRREDII